MTFQINKHENINKKQKYRSKAKIIQQKKG